MLKKRYPEQKALSAAIYRSYYKIMERIIGEDVPEYTQMLLNDDYNDFWINDAKTYVVDNLKIPVLFSEGWYDFYIDGMFSMWDRLESETKSKSAFVVGPWGHATSVKDSAEYSFANGNVPDDYIMEFFNGVRENYNLTETITKLLHLNENYKRGDVCTICIDTPPVGFTLKKGSRIRVDISSHSDMYVPHSNTKGQWAMVTDSEIAKNTVICDKDAYIVLPMR